MKVESLEEKINNLKRPTLGVYPDAQTGFYLRYSSSKSLWIAGFSRTANGETAFSGRTPTEAMDMFLENFTFED